MIEEKKKGIQYTTHNPNKRIRKERRERKRKRDQGTKQKPRVEGLSPVNA